MRSSRLSLALAAFCLVHTANAALQLFPETGKKLETSIAAAYDAYKLQDYQKAAKLFQAEANKGNSNALFAMGRMYQDGTGVTASAEIAEEYYKKAAAAGHEAAPYNLSLLMIADKTRQLEGIKQLEATATKGYVRAQVDIAQLYLAGQGVTKDATAARGWLEKASKQANGEDAFFLLGQLSETGQGAAKSVKEAIAHYEQGAQRNNMQSILRLADIYATGGEEVKADITKAKKYLSDAADREENAATARYNLGVLLEKVEKKLPEAYTEYNRAAERGDMQAMLKTAVMLQNGEGTGKDAKAAADWFEKAAKAGAPAAMYSLGQALEKGEGREKDAVKGWEWIMKAGLTGNPTAMRDLGLRYRKGAGASQDMLAATTWLQKAFQAGDVESGLILSEMLEKGEEVSRDLKASTGLLTQVAQLGVADAVVRLADNTSLGKGTPQDLIRAYALLLVAADYEPAKKRREELAKTMTKEQLADAEKEKERILGQRKEAAPAADKTKGK
jgi:uncharacterized protein